LKVIGTLAALDLAAAHGLVDLQTMIGRLRATTFRSPLRLMVSTLGDPLLNCLVHTLTRIYFVEYTKRMESVFEIIAEPNRRAILSLLVSSQQSVGEIERQLRMPQPTVSKHLRVLREAGFVESTVDAQRRLYRLKPEPLQEVDAWLAPFRRFWSAHLDALERHLDHMDQSTPTKRKTRTRPRGPIRERDKGEAK
jgi:DNA-binding transcriptional ArsR family regulator